LHDATLLDAKDQVGNSAGILTKIGSQKLSFRIIIMERAASAASEASRTERRGYDIFRLWSYNRYKVQVP
jgi:hypothetical protein